jgi:radical SAM superfamily enzyme YgiQ (UPF0313 family)
MKGKVLFINPNFQEAIKAISQVTIGPPLGLAYLAAVLEKDGFAVEILDSNALKYDDKKILNYIGKFNPDVIGMTAVTPTIKHVSHMADSIRKLSPKVKIILGGVHPSVLPEDTLKRSKAIDVIVMNEGEMIISRLCSALISNQSLSKIDGIAFREGSKIIINHAQEYIQDLDTIPFPARHLLPMEKYMSVVSSRFTTMIAMRGCYASCNYCSVPFFSGRLIRRRSPENIIQEMVLCSKLYRTRHFSFLDDTFTTDKRWVHDLCKALRSKGLHKRFTWMCLTRVDNVDEALLRDMKSSGCIKIEFGIESGSQKILDFSKKGINKDQIRRAFKIAKKVGLPTLGFLIVNMPLETEETIKESKEFVLELDPDFLQISFATPYPGTDLEKYAKENNLKIEKDWSKFIFLNEICMENENISKKRLLQLKKDIEVSFYLRPGYLVKMLLFAINNASYDTIFFAGVNGIKNLLKRR